MTGTVFKHTRAARAALALVCRAGAARLGSGCDCANRCCANLGDRSRRWHGYSAAIEQCVTSTVQAERSATFTAQMTATDRDPEDGDADRTAAASARRKRIPHDCRPPASASGAARNPGVKIYKYVKQVTNLDAPAAYRALVRFRWLGEQGTRAQARRTAHLALRAANASRAGHCPAQARRHDSLPRRPARSIGSRVARMR